jgi:hypothetical protein
MVSCLELKVSKTSNSVYAASFLYAWDKIQDTLGGDFSDFSSQELEIINNTKTHEGVLSPNEYNSTISWKENRIEATSEFDASLEYSVPMEISSSSLNFGTEKVESFGFVKNGAQHAEIKYFLSEDDFAVSIFCENPKQELILIKTTISDSATFLEEVFRYDANVRVSENMKKLALSGDESLDPANYFLIGNEKMQVPIIDLSFYMDYLSIVGSKFNSKKGFWVVGKAYQEIAFKMDQNGAEVKSYAVAALSRGGAPPKIQEFIYDKPFIIMMKNKGSKYPYFMAVIRNSELMNVLKSNE